MRFNAALARRVALILGLSFPAFSNALADGRAVLPPRWMVEAYLSDALVKPSRDDIARAIIPGLGMVPAFVGGFSGLAGATAWNPSDKTHANLVLSNGNLTATNTVSAVDRGVRAVQSRSSGKYYWEIFVNTANSNFGIGARSATAALTGAYPGVSGGGFSTRGNGSLTYGASTAVSSPIGSYATGDVLGFAVDLSGLVYLRKNGTWGSGQDPVAGTGGVNYGGGTLFPHVNLTAIGDQVTANFGATPFVYPAPAGFTPGFA